MDKRIKVLYLSYDGMTDPLGQSQVLPYLSGLSKQGYEFHLISFEKKNKFEELGSAIRDICDENGIFWYPFMYTKTPPVLSTLYDVFKMKQKARQLYKEHQFKIVHCRSYLAALTGESLQKAFDIKFVFDMRGFWADERIDGGIWSLKNPLMKKMYHYFKRKEIDFFTKADHVISLTENGKNEILSWKSFQKDRIDIEVIPCCVDMKLFYPVTDQSVLLDLRKRLHFEKTDFILGYVGSIGTWYMLPEMLDYFKILKQEKPHAKFLFVSGENPVSIQSAAQQKGIDLNDLTIVSCAHKEVPLYISIFNQSIFFIKPAYSKKASSPTKQGEIMAMGIPVVCNVGVGDSDYIVKKFNAGILIESFEDEAYLEAIRSQRSFDPEELTAGAKSFFSLENGVQKYLAVYKKILNDKL